jgi:hypothetical protein
MTIDGNDGLRDTCAVYIYAQQVSSDKDTGSRSVGRLSMGRDAQCKSKEELFE